MSAILKVCFLSVVTLMTVCNAKAIDLNIREAELRDLDSISALCDQFGFPATRDQLTRRITGIKQKHSQVLYVAEDSCI
jgi:hypothetical protein